jgi:DNA-binding HxlR family transcriptional regulator
LTKSKAKELITFLSDGPKRFKDIAYKGLKLAPSTASRRLKEMTEQGIIEIKYDSKERAEKYQLTMEGCQKIISALEREIRGFSEILEKIKK